MSLFLLPEEAGETMREGPEDPQHSLAGRSLPHKDPDRN